MISRRRVLAWSTASALGPLLPASRAQAQTQNWPSRFVRLIVPLAPGGPTDVAARLIAEPLTRMWGQQVVIENKAGGGTNIASDLVAKAEPDGYTILYATSSLAVNPVLQRVTFDPVADFEPVSYLFSFPFYFFVPNSSPAKTVQEFIAHAKANPGKVAMASPGTGSMPHLTAELFKRMAGLEWTHVPYRGAGPVLNDLIPGRVDGYFASGSLLENVRAGQIRGLGVTSSKRDAAAPDIPTIAESGLPGFDVMSWQALFVPARTPPDVVRRINTAANAALADPAIKAKLQQMGYVAVGSTPEELAKLLRSEIEKWTAVIKSANITLN